MGFVCEGWVGFDDYVGLDGLCVWGDGFGGVLDFDEVYVVVIGDYEFFRDIYFINIGVVVVCCCWYYWWYIYGSSIWFEEFYVSIFFFY